MFSSVDKVSSSEGSDVPQWLPGLLEQFSGQGEILGAL